MTISSRLDIQPEKANLVMLLFILFLVIPFRLIIDISYDTEPIWAANAQQLGMYVALCLLTWINRNHLRDFHIGKLSVWVLILSGTLSRIDAISFVNLLFWLFGVVLLIANIRGYFSYEPQQQPLIWLIISFLIGIGVPVLLNSFRILFSQTDTISTKPWPGLLLLGIGIVVQILRVAVFEELIFRGFLWGYLEKRKWNIKWILVFQGALFWISHLFYFTNKPTTFWLYVPIMGLVLGYLAWRSRSVTVCMISHALYNTLISYF